MSETYNDYDMYVINEELDRYYDKPRCLYCGKFIVWKQLDNKWHAYTSGQPHTCKQYYKKQQ